MTKRINRRQAVGLVALGSVASTQLLALRVLADEPVRDELPRRASPADYSIAYSGPTEELIGDLLHTERGDPKRESTTPHQEWYSDHVRGAWGRGVRNRGSTHRSRVSRRGRWNGNANV